MVSVIDTGPLVRSIKIGEEVVPLTGISFENLVPMLDRFPELKKMLTPSRGELDPNEFTFEGFLKLGPRILAAAIAAGMGKAGDSDTEKIALGLGIGVQVKILREIIDMTFPGGIGPFVEDLKAIGLLGREEAVPPSGGTGRGPAMNSSLASPSSTSSDIPIQ